MVDDGGYGWEEVYEAYGCTPDYSDPSPGKTAFSLLHQDETREEHASTALSEPSVILNAGSTRTLPSTPTLIPSPG